MHRLRHLHACAQIERARLLALATEEELALLKRTQALAEEVPEHCSSREKDFPCKAMLLRLVLASLLTPQAARAHACGHVLDRGHRHVEHCDGPGCEGCMHEEGVADRPKNRGRMLQEFVQEAVSHACAGGGPGEVGAAEEG